MRFVLRGPAHSLPRLVVGQPWAATEEANCEAHSRGQRKTPAEAHGEPSENRTRALGQKHGPRPIWPGAIASEPVWDDALLA